MSAENDVLEVTIDRMNMEDLPQILEIEKESFPAPWSPGMFINEMNNPAAQCICARVNFDKKSVVVAYTIFRFVVDVVHLHNLAVKNQFRRQHLASNLLNAMEEIAKKVGINAITLEVRPSNTAAIDLYQQRGFIVKGRRPNYYPETKEDALIMWAYLK